MLEVSPVGQGALRRLSADVGNLSAELAVCQSTIAVLYEIASQINPDEWQRQMVPIEPEPTSELLHPEMTMVVTLTEEQHAQVMRVLGAIREFG